MRILALSGSLRSASTNSTLLRAAALLAPASVEVKICESPGRLPHLNPDLDTETPPSAVADFRAHLQACAGVLICTPEYAHGVPGMLKNALDWVVSSGDFVGKPVALLKTSYRGEYAQASLTETLTVMMANIVPEASVTVPITGRNLDAEGIASEPELALLLRNALTAFIAAIEALPVEAQAGKEL